VRGIVAVVHRFSLGRIDHLDRSSGLLSPTGYDTPSE